MRKEFRCDGLTIKNNSVEIRSRDDADLVVGVLQLVRLIRAGCRFDEVVVLRSEPMNEDGYGDQ
jgi:hypothetical protein